MLHAVVLESVAVLFFSGLVLAVPATAFLSFTIVFLHFGQIQGSLSDVNTSPQIVHFFVCCAYRRCCIDCCNIVCVRGYNTDTRVRFVNFLDISRSGADDLIFQSNNVAMLRVAFFTAVWASPFITRRVRCQNHRCVYVYCCATLGASYWFNWFIHNLVLLTFNLNNLDKMH